MQQIQYQPSGNDLVKGYFYLLQNSPKFRTTMILYAFVFGCLVISIEVVNFSSPLSVLTFGIGILFAVGYIFLSPYFLRFLSKKGVRKIELTENGIFVSAGKYSQTLPWRSISHVTSSEDYILIVQKTGNFMCIPKNQLSSQKYAENFWDAISQRKY